MTTSSESSDRSDSSDGSDRFSGFAALYDRNRPSPPPSLGPLLRSYANAPSPPAVVDLGSGSGLSTRWAASWAASVVGIEPSEDMRTQAESRNDDEGVSYRSGTGAQTGLSDGCADIVIAVQALHWMEPLATLAEVNRILKPGGVFAAIDADWPPIRRPIESLAFSWRVRLGIRC